VTVESEVLVAPKSQEPKMVPDSLPSDSMDAHAQELAPESEMVPDSLPPDSFVCARCHLVHETMRTAKHGTVRTHGSGMLALQSCS
jgi:hypothetical protein